MMNESEKFAADDIFELLNKCSDFFVAMGDDVRRTLLIKMIEAGKTGINVQNLTKFTGLSRPAVSHHVKILKDCGLVKSYKAGTSNLYYVDLNQELCNIKSFVATAEKILNCQ